MPIYEIQTPDGRILEIEGDREPNESEINSFVSELFQPPTIQQPQFPVLPEQPTLPDVLAQPTPQIAPWQGGVVRSVIPGSLNPEQLLPAVRKIGGEIAVGKPGDTHPDIIKGENIPAVDIDQRGFVGPGGKFIDREAAAIGTQLPTQREPGRLHSTDLPTHEDSGLPEMIRPQIPTSVQQLAAQNYYARQASGYPAEAHVPPPAEFGGTKFEPVGFGIPKIIPPEEAGRTEKVAAGIANTVTGLANFFLTPEGIATLMGGEIIAGLKAGSTLKALGESLFQGIFGTTMTKAAAEQLGDIWGKSGGDFSKMDPREVTEFLGTTLMDAMIWTAPHIATMRRARLDREREREMEDVHEELADTRARLQTTEESDPARVALLAKQADLQQRVDLRQTWEDQVIEASKGTGRTVRIVDDDLGGGNIAKTLKTGEILVNRDQLHKWLELDLNADPAMVGKGIQSLVNQEVIHAAIPRSHAEAFWNTLSPAEKALEQKLYRFDSDASEAQKGHEAIRRRIELANGMKPLEFLAYSRGIRMKMQSLQALESALQAARTGLARKGNRKLSLQIKLIDRAQRKINEAKKGAIDATKEGQVQAGVPTERARDDARRISAEAGVSGGLPAAAPVEEKAQVSLAEEAPPAAPTGEAPPAVPAEGITAISGVAPPVEPAVISEAKPTTKEAQVLPSRQKIVSTIKGKEQIAKSGGGEYVGTLHGKDVYEFTDPTSGRKVTVNAPEGSPIEVVSKMLDDLVGPEEPFAKRQVPEDWREKFKDLPPPANPRSKPAMVESATGEVFPAYYEGMGFDPDNPAKSKPWISRQVDDGWSTGPIRTGESIVAGDMIDQQPAARRGKWKGPVEREQLGLGLEKAFAAPGTAPVVERALKEGEFVKPLTDQEISGVAANMASKPVVFGTRPSRKGTQVVEGKVFPLPPESTKKIVGFEDFYDYVTSSTGVKMSRAAAMDKWRDAVNADVEASTPERLAQFVEAYDLVEKLGLRRDDQGNIVGIPGEVSQGFELKPLEEGQPVKKKIRSADSKRAEAYQKQAELFWQAAQDPTITPEKKADLMERMRKSRDASLAILQQPIPQSITAEEGVETIYRKGKKYTGAKERRAQIMQAVLTERLKDIAPKADLNRKAITLEDIDFNNPDTVEGSFRKLTADEAKNPDVIMRILGDQAETKDAPKSNTKRLLVVVKDGKVYLLSSYYDATAKVGEATVSAKPTRAEDPFFGTGELNLFQRKQRPGKTRKVGKMVQDGWQMIVDPGKIGTMDRPNRRMTMAFLKEYHPIGSILLRDPVKDFQMRFDSVKAYVDALEKRGLEIERPERGGFAGEGGEEAAAESLSEKEQDLQYWREELTAEAERQEQELPPSTGVREGEGGMFHGPEAMEARLREGTREGEISKSRTAPLQASEVQGIRDWLVQEMGDPAKPSRTALEDLSLTDMFDSVKALADMAKQDLLEQSRRRAITQRRRTGKVATWRELMSQPMDRPWLRGIHRKVISALQKISDRIYESSYDKKFKRYTLTPQEAYENAIIEIHRLIGSEQPEFTFIDPEVSFVQGVMAQFGERPDRPVGIPGIAQVAPRAKGVSREILDIRAARPGGKPVRRTFLEPLGGKPEPARELTPEEQAYAAEQAAAGKPYKPTEGMVVEPGPFKRAKASPEAAVHRVYDRPIIKYEERPFELRAEGELPPERIGVIVGKEHVDTPAARRRLTTMIDSSVKRRTVGRDIPRLLDGSEHIKEVEAVEDTNAIILASVKGLDEHVKKHKLTPEAIDRLIARRAQDKEGAQIREAAIAVQATIDMPDKKAEEKAKKLAEKYGMPLVPEPPPMPNPGNINKLIEMANLGIEKAKNLIRTGNEADKWVGRRWQKAAERLKKSAEWARDNWKNPQLHETVAEARKRLDDHLQNQRLAGQDIQEVFNYMPGVMEGEVYNPGLINFAALEYKGTNYRMPKKFANPYEAIAEGPYIPASYDIATRAGHRIRQGNHIIARREWQEAMKGLKDPVSGKEVFVDPQPFQRQVPTYDTETGKQKIDEETGEKVTHMEYGYTSPDVNTYVLIDPNTGRVIKGSASGVRPLAVMRGFESIVTGTLSKSAIRDDPIGRSALFATSALKHGWVLMLDSFHLGRLTQYAAAAMHGTWAKIRGKDSPGWGVDYRGGHSALTWAAEDMQKAVDKGIVHPASMKWALEPITVNVGKGRKVQMTRHQILREMVSQGLNAGKISDAMYKDLIKEIPIFGQFYKRGPHQYNKWLFDHFVPGIMAETAVRNFESVNARNPDVPVGRLIKDTIRDTNAIYGNMGRQGFFRNATVRDFLQIFLLAPGWREGLLQKEIRFYARSAASLEHGGRVLLNKLGAKIDPKKNLVQQFTGREGLPPMGMIGEMMARGLATYFVIGQVINLLTTYERDGQAKFTWQNDEEGHKLDAWLPIGDRGVWLPTLGVFGEITGDMIRIGEAKENNWQVAVQMGLNMLGPVGRAANTAYTQESMFPKEKLTTSWGVSKATAAEMFPAPISLSTGTRALGHRLFPGQVAPNEPGTVPQRAMGSLGFRVHRATDDISQIKKIAKEWADEKGIPEPAIEITPNELASVSKLRHAISIDDEGGARSIYNELWDRYDKTPRGKGTQKLGNEDMIIRAMKIWRDHPFTGSDEKEDEFRASLSSAGQNLYSRAELQRMLEFEKFMEFMSRQPLR